MSERKVKPLAALEAWARQLLLMVGFGFVAFTGGTILSVMLMNRLEHRLVAADSRVLNLAVVILVGQLWILFVLPTLIHLAARFLELPIWRSVIIATATGTLFNAAIRVVSNGVEQTFADPLQDLVWGGSLVAGVFLAVWAGKQGRAWAERRQQLADRDASGRKAQYEQFLAESTALADRRDAAKGAAPVEPGAVDPKPPA